MDEVVVGGFVVLVLLWWWSVGVDIEEAGGVADSVVVVEHRVGVIVVVAGVGGVGTVVVVAVEWGLWLWW